MRAIAMLRAATLLSCALTAFSVSAAQVAPRAPEAWQPLVKRTYRLQDLNFTKPLIFSGAEAGQQIFFRLPITFLCGRPRLISRETTCAARSAT